jgi:hypothetical protein
MRSVVIMLVIILIIGLVFGFIAYFHARKIFREQKNYERGLKMVPLLIHLPPLSEDIDSNGRDNRDIVEENISKAQIMYDIIASTVQKGLKHNFYGQRHISFEIIASNGFVNFFVAVPIVLSDVVQQAIVSAYPTARLEEVPEHNMFNETGKLSGTVGGELSLKNSFAYPIATYQESKRDGIQSILNSLSSLEKEDGVGIQMLLRPASPDWRKRAHAVSSKKRKGKETKQGTELAFWWVRQMFTALHKPPEDKSGDGGSKHELSSLDQTVVDSIDDKTRYSGFEVLVRVVASSSVEQRSRSVLNNIIATFSLFDSQGKNGFKYSPSKDIEKFVTSYILRFFPQENNQNILNTVELATLFHFPDQKNIPTTQLSRQQSKQVDGPRNMSDEGLLLGYNVFRGSKKPVRLGHEDRRRHMYAVGQTGTGKSTFLENLAIQDMINGEGFAFIDPHGDTAENLLANVPKERTEDVIYFCPADMEYPLGLNMFEYDNDDQKDFLVQEAINMLEKLYDPNNQGIIGPRYHHLFRNAALTVMADPAGGTFVDIPKLFRDPEYVKQKLKHVTDPNVLEFWQKEMPQSQRSNDFGEVVSWFVSKFGAFLSNHMMRNIIGQTKSAFNLRDIMDNKKILIVNLSKGRTGDLNSKLLGMIFVMKFQAAAMSRSSIPEDERVDFCLYVDEFQNFSTDSFATILSEARKYRFNLIVANQFTTQLSEEIRDAVFGNVGTIVAYRIGQNDVESLARYFQPLFDGDDLLRVPNFNAVVRTLIHGVPTQSFSMSGIPPISKPNKELFGALKQLSNAKYGRPRAVVDAEITERMKTITPEKPPLLQPANGTSQGGLQPVSGPAGTQPKATGIPGANASFLDQWLAKRQTTPQKSANPNLPSGIASNDASTQTAAVKSSVPVGTTESPVQVVKPPVSAVQTAEEVDRVATPPVATNIPSTPQGAVNTANVQEQVIDKSVNTDNAQTIEPSPSNLATKDANGGVVHLRGSSSVSQQPEDTIVIDREGNLQAKDS